MEKTAIIAIVLAILLIAGAVFASAAFLQENKEGNGAVEISPQPACGCGCNQQCGGNCGIQGCSCGG